MVKEEGNFMKGLLWAVLLSVPLWGLILIVVYMFLKIS